MFMNRIAELVTDPAQLMSIDKAAHKSKTSIRKMGWFLKGQQYFQQRIFVCGQRVSILLVPTIQGIMAYNIIPGSVTSACFTSFVQEYVVIESILCYMHEKLITHGQVPKVSLYFIIATFTWKPIPREEG